MSNKTYTKAQLLRIREKDPALADFLLAQQIAEYKIIEGAKGDKGDQGEKGDRGEKGNVGEDAKMIGPTGKIGPEGPKGEKGDKGADSIVKGPKGDEGKKGERGFTGLSGKDGEDGKDLDERKPVEIARALDTLVGNDRIDAKSIKNLPKGLTGGSGGQYLHGGGKLTVLDEGITLNENVRSLDFVGGNITATNDGRDVTITVTGGGGTSTLAGVSTESDDTAKSLYTMTSGVDVEFRDSSGDTHLLIEENGGTTIGNGTAVLQAGVVNGFAITGADNTTDATAKLFRIAVNNYTNADEPVTMISALSASAGGTSEMAIGGGTALGGSMQKINFFIGNGQTPTGTQKMSLTNSVLTVDTAAHVAPTGSQFASGTTSPSGTYKNQFSNVFASDFSRLALFEQIVNTTNGVSSPMSFKLTTTGNMADGFGPGFLYAIEDVAGVENFIARTSAIRNGADNTGMLQIDTASGGTLGTRATFSSDRISLLQDVAIGTIAPVSPLHIYENNSSTSNATGITVEQDGTGDAIIQFLLTGARRWVVGVDNSDSDKFKIASTGDLNTNAHFIIDVNGNVEVSDDFTVGGRLLGAKSADIASATVITFGDGNYADVTGTTQVDGITATGWTAGSLAFLQFDGIVLVKHNTASSGALILLDGGADFTSSANDVLPLVFDGTNFRSIAPPAVI